MTKLRSVKKFNSLGEAVSTIRMEIGISQRELSRRTGVDNNTIAKIEKGERKKINILSLKKIAYALGIVPDELLKLGGYTDEEIKLANSDKISNLYLLRDDNKVILFEELVNREFRQNEAYKIVASLIDNIDINKLDEVKGMDDVEKKDIEIGLKMLQNNLLAFYDRKKREIESSKNEFKISDIVNSRTI